MEKTLKEELYKYFNSILDKLVEKTTFGAFLKDRTEYTYYQFHERTKWGIIEELGIEIFNGASRVVIVPTSYNKTHLENYVLKIPYQCLSKDYCKVEKENYDAAKKDGCSQFFAEIDNIGIYEYIGKNIPLYAMVRAEVDPDKVRSFSGENRVTATDYDCDGRSYTYSYDDYDSENGVITCLESFYSSDEMQSYLAFVNRKHINDIHDSNIGFLSDGRVVVTDYAGYDG